MKAFAILSWTILPFLFSFLKGLVFFHFSAEAQIKAVPLSDKHEKPLFLDGE